MIDNNKREYDINGKLLNKKCNICFRMLPIQEYYSNKAQYDGHGNTCKECENASVSVRLKNYKRNAKNRTLQFNLTKDDFIQITSKQCSYCGGFGSVSPTGERYNGIDRIDSSKNYELDNVIPCCSICNKMKMDMSYRSFLYQIEKIYEYINFGGN